MSWIERKPESTDIPNAELASVITSNKYSFQSYVENKFYWTASSNASAGVPALFDGSTNPGVARAAFIPSSAISSFASASATFPLKSGSLVLTSDTSNLIGIASSTASMLLGGIQTIAWAVSNSPGGGTLKNPVVNNSRVLVQSGSVTTIATPSPSYASTIRVAFGTAYSTNTPFVLLTPIWSSATMVVLPYLGLVDTSGFTATLVSENSATASQTVGFYWRSLGTVTL